MTAGTLVTSRIGHTFIPNAQAVVRSGQMVRNITASTLVTSHFKIYGCMQSHLSLEWSNGLYHRCFANITHSSPMLKQWPGWDGQMVNIITVTACTLVISHIGPQCSSGGLERLLFAIFMIYHCMHPCQITHWSPMLVTSHIGLSWPSP